MMTSTPRCNGEHIWGLLWSCGKVPDSFNPEEPGSSPPDHSRNFYIPNCTPRTSGARAEKLGYLLKETLNLKLVDDRQEKEETEYPVPQVLWSLYLNLPASDIKLSDSAPSNIHLCSGPDLELDFDFAVNQRKLFWKVTKHHPKFEGGDIAEGEEKQDVEKAEKEEE
ncbi:Rab proteins geranylgeranyltransferase component A 1 [Temnothorax longispinosus]|uniref:Rab proteins geranylgeranyltransferase component A 1 n=1 Tax=Temnothorax longispinosus TaxID=300112 RepID=A0A4S2KW56_9HYME|nr:Rab proteins geranylgeranyltransferase component A 1 [Temnothorax longispinosus]